MPTKKNQPARDWLTSAEACVLLGISFPTLRRYIREGKLDASQVVTGGKIRVSKISAEQLFKGGINHA